MRKPTTYFKRIKQKEKCNNANALQPKHHKTAAKRIEDEETNKQIARQRFLIEELYHEKVKVKQFC